MIISRTALIVQNTTCWRFQFVCWFDGRFDFIEIKIEEKRKNYEISNERKIMVKKIEESIPSTSDYNQINLFRRHQIVITPY